MCNSCTLSTEQVLNCTKRHALSTQYERIQNKHATWHNTYMFMAPLARLASVLVTPYASYKQTTTAFSTPELCKVHWRTNI